MSLSITITPTPIITIIMGTTIMGIEVNTLTTAVDLVDQEEVE